MTEHLRTHLQTAQEPAIFHFGSAMRDLTEGDWMALNHLPVLHRFVGRGRTLLREGDPVSRLRVVCKGWAVRSCRIDDERRQILDFILPGDIVGLHVDGNGASLADIEALTPCEVGEIEMRAVERLAIQSPGVARGLQDILVRHLAQANDHLVRLGRMNAYERVCGFLLDIYTRQKEHSPGPVDFPITQTTVADALGLSVVHVNRQVMQLRREGLVSSEPASIDNHGP